MKPLTPRQLVLVLTLLAQLPHWFDQPVLLAGFWALLLAWAGLRAWQQRAPVSAFWLVPLAGAGAALILREYRTLFGGEAGVALFTTLLSLKLFESRTLRDLRLVLALDFFNTALHFLVSQTPWMAAYSLCTVTALLAGWLYSEREARWPELLRLSARMLLEGLPIAVLMFVFFPRLAGPLWAMPSERTARSGLSGEYLEPGSISEMAQDESVAFRVEFSGNPPGQEKLYWRGPVYERFDGRRWLPVPPGGNPAPTIHAGTESARYAITLEPHQQRWLLALDLPETIPDNTFLTNRFQLLSQKPVTQRERYELTSALAWRMDGEPSAAMQHLPAGNPRAASLAASWRALAPTQRVQAGLDYFADHHFAYTLTPPLLTSTDTIDEFLFNSRLGFCEHFASAYAWLMRAAGVPARIVGGYQGGTFNSAGAYMIVRQADAHVWVEVWLEGQGWQRVDPTAAVAPARISAGLAGSLGNQGANLPLMLQNGSNWLKSLRLNADVVLNAWNQWVIAYNLKEQMNILQKLGIHSFVDTSYLAWLSGLIALVFSVLAFHLLRRKEPRRDPASRLYRDFQQKLARQGLRCTPSEAPLSYARRAAGAKPAQAAAIEHITRLYLEVRYGNEQQKLAALRMAVRRFKP